MVPESIISILKERIKIFPYGEKSIYRVGPIQLPVNLDNKTELFQWYCWFAGEKRAGESMEEVLQYISTANLAEYQQSSVLVYGDFENAEEAFVRMHSICHTGDIFGSKRCDCGFQLKESMRMIVNHGAGALFYLANHEGRGIGLFSKAMTYIMQEQGFNTLAANVELEFPADGREYGEAITILQSLREESITLITNNPEKWKAMEALGVNMKGRVSLWGDVSIFNEKYIATKIQQFGHVL